MIELLEGICAGGLAAVTVLALWEFFERRGLL